MPPADDRSYRRTWWSWALYDVGNSAFYLTVVGTIFPFFFQDLYASAHASAGQDLRTRGGSALALTAGIAMAVVAVLGPVLGTIADRTAAKKRFLAAFMALGASASALMFFIPAGGVGSASVLYALGTVGVAGSIVFYDALLPGVAREGDVDRISSIGYALGYLGSVLLLVLNMLWIEKPGWFGLSGPGQAARLSFVSAGLWWALFTIPLLRRVPEPAVEGSRPEGNAVLAGFRQLGRTFRRIRKYRQLLLFLAAFWIYSDGIGTIIKMAAAFGYSMNVPKGHLMLALVITQVVGVPCALAFGRLARRTGAKAGILLGLGVYAAICLGAAFMSRTWHFYALAVGVGLVQGGTQALSRSLFASMIPRSQSGEFFGFFSTMEKFAGIVGPLLLGLIWSEGGDPRKGILVIGAFFVVGALLLGRVDVAEGRRAVAG